MRPISTALLAIGRRMNRTGAGPTPETEWRSAK
jgi:hypothetical protein